MYGLNIKYQKCEVMWYCLQTAAYKTPVWKYKEQEECELDRPSGQTMTTTARLQLLLSQRDI